MISTFLRIHIQTCKFSFSFTLAFAASSYSNQFRGNYESHEHHVPQYHNQHRFDHSYDDSSSDYDNSYDFTVNSNNEFSTLELTSTTTEYPTTTRYPATNSYPTFVPYFYPKERERVWESPTTTNRNDEISNEINLNDENEGKPIFSYDENDEYGPSKWHKINQQCNGLFQSPIDLNVKNASINRNQAPLQIEGMDAIPISIKVENNGHSMKLSFNYANNKKVRFIGGPLQTPHILDSVHWHWGQSDRAGSEHTFNSKRYSAEMHLVTFNSNYGASQSSIKQLLLFIFFN